MVAAEEIPGGNAKKHAIAETIILEDYINTAKEGVFQRSQPRSWQTMGLPQFTAILTG